MGGLGFLFFLKFFPIGIANAAPADAPANRAAGTRILPNKFDASDLYSFCSVTRLLPLPLPLDSAGNIRRTDDDDDDRNKLVGAGDGSYRG